jgi:hypothetical protein
MKKRLQSSGKLPETSAGHSGGMKKQAKKAYLIKVRWILTRVGVEADVRNHVEHVPTLSLGCK